MIRVVCWAIVLLGTVSCVDSRGRGQRAAEPSQPPPRTGFQGGGFQQQAPPGPEYCESRQQRAAMCPAEGMPATCARSEAQCLKSILRADFHASYLDCIRRHPCGVRDIDDLCMGLTLRGMPLITPMQNHVQQACLVRGPACPNKLAHNCRVLPRANEQVLHAVNGCFSHRDCAGVEQCVEHTLDRFGCP